MGEINRDKAVAALESLQKRGADLNPYSLAVELGVDYKQIIGDAETMQMLSYARGDVHGIVAAEYDRLLRRVDELSEELVKAQESSDSDLIDQISEELAAFKERNKSLTKQIKELEAANQVLALSIQDSYEQGNQAGKQELESAVYKAAEESYLKGFEAANSESEKKATEAFQKGISSAKLDLEQGLEEEMKQALEDSYQKGLEAGKASVEQGPWPFAEDVNTAELTRTPAESWKEGYESARLELEEQYGSVKEQAWKEGYESAKNELEEELADSGKASWQQGFESAKKDLAGDIEEAAKKAKQEGYDLARAELEDEIASANKASWKDGYDAAKNELEEELAESGKASWQQGYETAKRELEEKAAVSGSYDDGYNAAKSEFEEEMKKVRDEWWNEGYDTAALEFKNREKEKEREAKEVPSGDNAFEEGYQLAQMELEESFAKEREEIKKKAFEEAREELQKEQKQSAANPSEELLKLEWQKGFDSAKSEFEKNAAPSQELMKEEWQKGFDAARAELEQNQVAPDTLQEEWRKGFDAARAELEQSLAESQQDFWQQGYEAAKAELGPVAHTPEASNFIGEFEADEPSPSMEHHQEEFSNELPAYHSPEVEGISAEGGTVDGATIDGSDIDTIMDDSTHPAEEVTFEEQVSFEPIAEELTQAAEHAAHTVDPQAVSEMADFLVSPSSPPKLHSESDVNPDMVSTDERLFDDTSIQEPLSEGLFEPQLSDETQQESTAGGTWTAEDNQAETQGFAVPNYMDSSFFGADEAPAQNEYSQDPNAYSQDPNAYSQDPNAYSQDPNAYSQDPNTYSQDPNAYSQDPNASSQDPNAYSQDPNAYSQDPNAYSQDPNAYSQDPNAYSQDPSAYSQDPSAYSQDPNAYSQDPNAYSQDPNAYSQDPNAYGDQSGYAPDYSTGAEPNAGQYGYNNESGYASSDYGHGSESQSHGQEQDPGVAFQSSMDAGTSGGFGDPSTVNFDDSSGFAGNAQEDYDEEIEEEKPPAQKFDPNELRNLVQGRLHKHEEAAASDDGKVNRKFVGGKHQATNEHANMPRVVAPDIRRACKLLGLRPEDLSKAAVLEAWKREMAKPGVHPDTGGDTEMAMYLNNAKDTLVRYLDAQAPKLGKVFGSKGDHGGKDNKDKK